jgi:aminoglycoside 3-N-acetyltransferase
VIRALEEVLGPEGTLVMPAFSFNCFRADAPPFDPEESPSTVGLITETFRRQPNVLRSRHPSHSVTARGPDAAFITAVHDETMGPCCRSGPFGKLYELDAGVLFLGCGLSCNTTLHAVEDWAGAPYLMTVRLPVRRPDGSVATVPVPNEPLEHRSFSGPNHPLIALFRERGVLREGRVAAAESYLAGIRGMIDLSFEALIRDPAIFLCQDPNCTFCKRAHLLVHRVGYERLTVG